ncbi:hypothetical protein TOPH_08535 [Tolypocladium ophioglossoides CBS 100239]|uniref:Uncharacterized protein n=1 Tax=Tolypocladium ophioglossoides (strain CBS 100239) TaxID=1163406 RepID=A0A0L0MYD7_TOLOC|nr:hypothetical protein TOPH_08535 [Tolypocladium ophioglossoides CBS 100239]
MRILVFLAALYGVGALPASQSAGSCTPNALFTSLLRSGRQFCSSVLDVRCHRASTPTQFATYDPGVISSHCKCVVSRTCRHRATPTSKLSGTETTGASSTTTSGTGSQTSAASTETESSITSVTGSGSTTSTITKFTTTAAFTTSGSSSVSSVSSGRNGTSSNTSSATSSQSSGNQSHTSSVTSSQPSEIESYTSSTPSSRSSGNQSHTTSVTSSQPSEIESYTYSTASSQSSGNQTYTSSATPTRTYTSSVTYNPSSGSQTYTSSVASSHFSKNATSTSSPTSRLSSNIVTYTSSATSSTSSKNRTTYTWSSSRVVWPTTLPGNVTKTSRDKSSLPSVSSPRPTDPSSVILHPSSHGSLTRSPPTTSRRGSWNTTTTSPGASASGSISLPSTFTSASSNRSTAPTITSYAASTLLTTLSLTITNIRSSKADPSFTGWNSTSSGPIATTLPGTRWVSGSGTSRSTRVLTSLSAVVPTSILPNITTSTIQTPIFITPTGSYITTSTLIPNATTTMHPTLPAANFTQVTRTAVIVQETCYHLPQDPVHGRTHRALLHNADLREHNATIPFPYIEAVDFAVDGVDPLFLTLRDAAQGTHYIDVSNRSHISIVDSLGNAMLLDAQGIHFTTNSCRYDVSITVDSMYKQLAKLSGEVCSKGGLVERMDDTEFTQTLYLKDQCNNPVTKSVRKQPLLKIGDSECNDVDVDESLGKWVFDCKFPGPDSGTMKCQTAVKNDIVKFLFVHPFGGSCPDLSTIITTLETTSQDFLSAGSLRAELYNQGLNDAQKLEADLAVMYYEQLWEILKQALSKNRTRPPGVASAIEEYINTYKSYRSFEDDICEDLHAGDSPLKMSLRAGGTRIDAIATLNWAPQVPKPYNITIQDPSQIACCPNGSTSNHGQGDTCAYPDSALIANTACVCGKTVSGRSVAFEYTECDNFVSRCETDSDCAKNRHGGFLCLTGSCCGGGVCIDPYACAQNGTTLVGSGL